MRSSSARRCPEPVEESGNTADAASQPAAPESEFLEVPYSSYRNIIFIFSELLFIEKHVKTNHSTEKVFTMIDCKVLDELDATVIVCDTAGVILYMNDKADKSYEKEGGRNGLVGKSLFDCHPEKANTVLRELLVHKKSNIYTIEKNGVKKIIIQKPWYEKTHFKGLIEMVFELPENIPHHLRTEGAKTIVHPILR